MSDHAGNTGESTMKYEDPIVIVGATSASRDASNVDVLQGRVRRELGLDYRVLSGEEEAASALDAERAEFEQQRLRTVAMLGRVQQALMRERVALDLRGQLDLQELPGLQVLQEQLALQVLRVR
mgnify:CR=1 FL=1